MRQKKFQLTSQKNNTGIWRASCLQQASVSVLVKIVIIHVPDKTRVVSRRSRLQFRMQKF